MVNSLTRKAIVVAILAASSLALARRSAVWSYEKLLEEADLVVIGRVEKIEETELAFKGFDKTSVAGKIYCIDVQSTLKGDSSKKIKLLLFSTRSGQKLIDPPGFAVISDSGEDLEIKAQRGSNASGVSTGKPTYLLYLKRSEVDLFEPVSGRYDSVESVKELIMPLRSITARP